jgi:hypothetical protein
LNPSLATTVLALNEYGYASAYLKSYGGPSGTGLLQLSIPRATPTDLAAIKTAAEFGITW